MKRIMKFSLLLCAMLSVVLVSCENKDEYVPIIGSGAEVDFVSKIPVVVDNTAEFFWYNNDRAVSYTMQYSASPDFVEFVEFPTIDEETGDPGDPIIVYTAEIDTEKNGLTIEDLYFNTKYYARLRVNYTEDKSVTSDWSEVLPFETGDRIIPVAMTIQPAEIYGNTVIVRWLDKYPATHIGAKAWNSATEEFETLFLPQSENPAGTTLVESLMPMTEAEIEAAAFRIFDLPERTKVQITLYNLDVGIKDGTYNSAEFTTYIYLEDGMRIVTKFDNLGDVINAMEKETTLFLEEGWQGLLPKVVVKYPLTIKSDPYIYAQITSEAGMDIQGDGITIDVSNVEFQKTAQELIRLASTSSNVNVKFENCRFIDLQVALLRFNGNVNAKVNDFTVNNCWFEWTAATTGNANTWGILSCVNQPNPQLKTYNLTNSTLINARMPTIMIGKGSNSNGNTAKFDNFGFNMTNLTIIGANINYNWFRWQNAPEPRNVEKVIMALNPNYDTNTQTPEVASPTYINSFMTKDFHRGTKDFKLKIPEIAKTTMETFVDWEGGNYTIKDDVVDGTGAKLVDLQVGDPRWFPVLP